jgi:cytochrome c1
MAFPAALVAAFCFCAACERQSGDNDLDPVLHGKMLFEKNRCMACHRPGGIGVSLKNIAARMTRDEVRAWIREPKKIKPSTLMPQFRLNSEELEALTSFVMTL